MKKKVLVIEDEESVLFMAQRMLKAMGLESQAASTGKEALEAISRDDFDLIVADLKLPDAEGLNLIRAYKEKNSSGRVMVMTGYPTLDAARKAAGMGACEFLAKPFGVEEFKKAVKRCLDEEDAYVKFKNKKVLIVEDSASFSSLLTQILQTRSIPHACAAGAEEALEILEKDASIRVIVCDTKLPGMPGAEFCRKIKSGKGKNMSIILMSAAQGPNAALEEEAREAGADIFVAAPAEPYDLCLHVEKLLRV